MSSFAKQLLFFLSLVAVISFFDYTFIDTGLIGIDDGNIFLNYARHVAQGQGFVFNANGEKVEGFTSMLWVLVCAAAYLLSSHPEIFLICFSALLTALTITIVYRAIKKEILFTKSRYQKNFFLIYVAFIISIGPSFIAWSVLSLMENALWNFVFTLLVIMVSRTIDKVEISIREKAIIIMACCILSLTRPEALAWNLVFTCILLWTAIHNKRGIIFPVLYFAFFALTITALTVFRLHYFGYRFPNTYYAKVSSDIIYNIAEGSKYAIDFLMGYQPVITLLFVVLVVFLIYGLFGLKIINRNFDESCFQGTVIKKCCFIAIIILTGFLLPLTTGGDHFGGFRFYQSLLLLFAFGILVAFWLIKNYQQLQTAINKIILSIVIIFLVIISLNDLTEIRSPVKTQLSFEFVLAREGRQMAGELNTIFPAKKPSVGVIAVGGFSLKYQGNTVDLMGLNNTLMGHSPGDRKGIKNHAAFNKDIFYTLDPDMLLPVSVTGIMEATVQYHNLLDINNFDNQAMKNIFNDSSFKLKYTPVFISETASNKGIFAFVDPGFKQLVNDNPRIIVQKLD